MRYWHPFIKDVVENVKDYNPSKVILLPLYPQFSSTTTQSAFTNWYQEAQKQNLQATHHPVCCYSFDNHFIEAHVELLKAAYDKAKQHGKPRVLFSAHGLPEKTIDKGDPYQWQIERTVSAILREFGPADNVICYQSRVGPLRWIGPSTEEEIIRAGQDNVPLVVVPVSFVSEHSETLVELDIDYKKLADKNNVPYYVRADALGCQPQFIESLSWLCQATAFYPGCSNSLGRQCPKEFGLCGFKEWKV
jgi:ferrochelatase